jgi:hypothetical protein
MATSNSVQVQLTAAGIKLAAGGTISTNGVTGSFTFKAGAAVNVTPSEWQFLRDIEVNGDSLYELVPAAAASTPTLQAVPAKTPTASTAPASASTSNSKENPVP